MAAATRPGPFATKPTEQLLETAEGSQLNRSVGALDLTALGIGAIIGTGIFVIIGEAIAESGPAIVIAFVLAGVTCVFSALAYAELASTLPVSGSAYTYATSWPGRTRPSRSLCRRVPGSPGARTSSRSGRWWLSRASS